ncbi:Chaperone of endosialidase [Trichlorobacter thiogenes]|uniref:Chaperone of endosialidase n=1 Tax=Trichlorobacter thiogenes TaxID=115783 RepID=A0A1T4RK05_9BACT|nr:tail fiber domain-containing protein [Trichlorobacter thiogenes]SKA16078.1 Chaperone of endosialidase [Trichlorobacter thiogenes]
MKSSLRMVLPTLFAALIFSTFASATVPATLSYQGYLKNGDGTPVSTPVSITFRLYSVASGGSALWTETQPSVTPSNGIYQVILGSVTPLTLAFDSQYYLGVTVGADPEMTPRQPLTSVPYARKAASVDAGTQTLLTGATTNVGLIVKGVDSQTADLQQWQNSTGTAVAKLSPVGELTIGGALNLPELGLIKAGAYTLLHTTGDYNFFAGERAGNLTTTGSSSTGVGFDALHANTTGLNNSAFGRYALYSNTTGNYNSAFGASALYRTTSGSDNTAQGLSALYENTTGERNTATGSVALFTNTTGFYNTASGYAALYGNQTGSRNSAFGYHALTSQTSGSGNTAVGNESLFSNQPTSVGEGNYNTALGSQAGYANITGWNNTFIGAESDIGTATQLHNATAIGYNAKVSQSNSLVLGGTGLLAVKVGIGTETPTATLDVRGTARINDNDLYLRGDINHGLGWYGTDKAFATVNIDGPVLYGWSGGALGITNGGQKVMMQWGSSGVDFSDYTRFKKLSSGATSACLDFNNSISTCSSDARLKKDVVNLADTLDLQQALARLRGVAFTWDSSNPRGASAGGGRDIGMIAQEVEAVFPEIVHTDQEGYKSLDYPKLVAFLIEVNKAQAVRLQDLDRKFDALQQRLSALEAK